MDTATGQSNTYGYDDFDRLSSTSMNNGQQTYQYVYDRWGNRWQQNAPQGGVTTSYTFDPTTNHINGTGTNNLNGLAYDAAGNLTNDGNGHTFTYDADGNVVAVDGGQTARYVYDAMGRRTRIQAQRGIFEFAFDADGQRVSTWNAGDHSFSEGLVYWDGQPIAFRTNGTLFFQHQDWIGTERLRTGPSASLVSFFTSLPFGDNYSASGNDWDWYHLAGLDFDPESNTDHATFRQYSHQEGRWMSPDPYDGSMDLGNPQSLNRYSYAANSPLVYTDPLGLRICNGSPADSDGPCTVAGGGGLGDIYTIIVDVFDIAGWFSHPTFHGSLQPRPSAAPNNPCSGAGNAPDPSYYANQGHADRNNPIQSTNHTLFGFPEGGANDAQPSGGSPYYANYVYGAYMQQAGFPQSVSIILANEYSVFSGYSRRLRGLGPKYDPALLKGASPWAPALPASNVTAITQGFNAARNGTLCHK